MTFTHIFCVFTASVYTSLQIFIFLYPYDSISKQGSHENLNSKLSDFSRIKLPVAMIPE